MSLAAVLMSVLVPAGAAHAQPPAENTDYFITNSETGWSLDRKATVGNGAPVWQTGFFANPSQEWSFELRVDEYGSWNDRWWIRNGYDNRCAGISGGALNDGAPAIMWDCNSDAWANYWFVREAYDSNGRFLGYQLRNVWSGKCLAIPGGSTEVPLQAIQWTCINDPDQRWFLS